MALPSVFVAPGRGPDTTPVNGSLGGGFAGASPAPTVGVVIAFDDPWDAVNPTWTRIDDPAGVDVVSEWSIDRGRSYELDKTATGVATLKLIDTRGLFDPTNSSSPYYGKIDPSKQAAICLTNPANGTSTMLFRGFVEDFDYTLDTHEGVMYVEISLVDALERLAAAEVVPANAGTTPPDGSGVAGDVLYISQQVDDRIRAALADAGWPTDPALNVIFSGNVAVQDVVYAPRTQILAVIQDAADAEWPGVANFFVAKAGAVTFHGRRARFNPTAYGLGSWKCGDTAAIASDNTRAVISGLDFTRGATQVINAALSTPQGVKDEDVPGQLSVDTGSLATHGVRSWSAENLTTRQGDEAGTPDALAETKKYADYYKNNYATPRNRVKSVMFRPQDPNGTNGLTLWTLICGVEIGDAITVTTTHPGGGGFNEEPFVVEGVHYDAKPMTASYPEVTLTLDLSPQGYFNDSGGLFSPR